MENIKRVHVIACGVLGIDLRDLVKELGFEVSLQFLPGGLHSTPRELRRQLQDAIDDATARRLGDMIAVGYGVCGLGVVGIHARTIPLAIPRVHDCIALFLGSDRAYKEQFAKYPGTYYVSAGWVEEKATPQCSGKRKEAPGPDDADFDQLVRQFGQENAGAIRYFLDSWQRNYQRAAFIDTGVTGRRHYAELAKAMAGEFGWKYEELSGSGELLRKLLTQRQTSDEILIVPPHHVTAYDAAGAGLRAVPVWEKPELAADTALVLEGQSPEAGDAGRVARMGLGIDAGGTYTDVAIYDFAADRVLQKAKALTTKWDFTVGITKALDQLDAALLRQVDMVSISTTLATNAIVEGRGQKVGLLILPPYGLFDDEDISYRPIAVLSGKLQINGSQIAPVDAAQVSAIVRDMVERQQVEAFAVCGFASHVNPAHELEVKRIIQDATGLHVSCGHEVAQGVNYRIRAETAVLNARIIPCLAAFLDDVRRSLHARGIDAPEMVVKSDGSLMNLSSARQRPVETILSGPAASVAGARYLAGADEALVVDIGGTTTDTAIIRAGAVETCEEGATVGGWKTLVRALDMRTLGLGGDSLIALRRGQIAVGPRRVAPISWLARQHESTAKAMAHLRRKIDYFDASTGGMELLTPTGREHRLTLGEAETLILTELAAGPLSMHELAQRLGYIAHDFLPLARLEENHIVQRCGLTPTDLLHVLGKLQLWDAAAARQAAELFALLTGEKVETFAKRVQDQFVRILAVELFKKQLDQRVEANLLEDSPVAMEMMRNLLEGGTSEYRLSVELKRPIVGIGAPVHFFLPQAAEMLGTRAIIPPNADVANAVGAITSSVCIQKHVHIVPDDVGRYRLEGLPGTVSFAFLEEAQKHALEELPKMVRQLARQAGTSQTRVEILLHDKVAALHDGGQLFLGRTVKATLSGQPDLAAR